MVRHLGRLTAGTVGMETQHLGAPLAMEGTVPSARCATTLPLPLPRVPLAVRLFCHVRAARLEAGAQHYEMPWVTAGDNTAGNERRIGKGTSRFCWGERPT